MKRLFLGLAVMIATFSAVQARQLDCDEALARAFDNAPAKVSALNKTAEAPRLMSTKISEKGNNAIYIFNTPDHTLFVSADDRAPALLGYTDQPITDFDKISPATKNFLTGYTRQIDYNIATNAPEYTSAKKKAQQSGGIATTSYYYIAPQLSTRWDQGYPFNMYSPRVNGQETWAGCVATAMAQVMNYHRWPSTCNFYTSYWWQTGYQQLSENISYSFDWSAMAVSGSWAETSYQQEQLGKLLKACAYSVEMDFDPDGSGAYSYKVADALKEKFDYSASTSYYYRDMYDYSTWESMLFNSLAGYGPIIYSGYGDIGGHEFVLDGYDNGRFHINWGWSGTSDGYYYLDALNPSNLGAGGGSGGFNTMQDAVINIAANSSGGGWDPPTPPTPSYGSISLDPSALYFSCNQGETVSAYVNAYASGLSDNIYIWADDSDHVILNTTVLSPNGGTVYLSYNNTWNTGTNYTTIHFRSGDTQADLTLECNVNSSPTPQPIPGSISLDPSALYFTCNQGEAVTAYVNAYASGLSDNIYIWADDAEHTTLNTSILSPNGGQVYVTYNNYNAGTNSTWLHFRSGDTQTDLYLECNVIGNPTPVYGQINIDPSMLIFSCDKGQTVSANVNVSTSGLSDNISVWADDAQHVTLSTSVLSTWGGSVNISYNDTWSAGTKYTTIHFRSGSTQADMSLECTVKDTPSPEPQPDPNPTPDYGKLIMGIKGELYGYQEGGGLILKTGEPACFQNISNYAERVMCALQVRNYDTGNILYIPETLRRYETIYPGQGYSYLAFEFSNFPDGKYLVAPAYMSDSHFDFWIMDRPSNYGNAIPVTVEDGKFRCGWDRIYCCSRLYFEEQGFYNAANLFANGGENGYTTLYLKAYEPEGPVELFFEGEDADQFQVNRPFGDMESGYLTIIHTPTRPGTHRATLVAHCPWTRGEFEVVAETGTVIMEEISLDPTSLIFTCGKGEVATANITVATQALTNDIAIWADDSDHVTMTPTSLPPSGGTVHIAYNNTQDYGMHNTFIHFRSGSAQANLDLECNVKVQPLDDLAEKYSISDARGNATEKGYDARKIRNFAYGDGKLYCVYNVFEKPEIIVLNAQTGDLLGRLRNGNCIGNGLIALSDVAVIQGRIFACNLVANDADPIRVYCWENDNSAPYQIFSDTDKQGCNRLGDAMSVAGTYPTDIQFAFANDNGTDRTNIVEYTFNIGSVTSKAIPVLDESGNYLSVGSNARPYIWGGNNYWIDGNNINPAWAPSNGNGAVQRACTCLTDGDVHGASHHEFQFHGLKYAANMVFRGDNHTAAKLRMFHDPNGNFSVKSNVVELPVDGLGNIPNSEGLGEICINTDGNSFIEAWVFSAGQGLAYITLGNVPVTNPEPLHTPILSVDRSEHDFGSTTVHEAVTVHIPVFTEHLSQDIDVALYGMNANMFKLDGRTIAPNAEHVKVTYAPTAVGNHTCYLSIAARDYDATHVITLSGSAGQVGVEVAVAGHFIVNINDGLITVAGTQCHNIDVYNAAGAQVASAVNNNQVDCRHLPHGVYILNIKDTNGAKCTVKIEL